MAQYIIENEDSGYTVRTELNNMFSELYAGIPAPTRLLSQTGNIILGVNQDSYVEKISLLPVVGSPTVSIGTTPTGQEVLQAMSVAQFMIVVAQVYFQGAGNLYISISGGSVDIRIDLSSNYML